MRKSCDFKERILDVMMVINLMHYHYQSHKTLIHCVSPDNVLQSTISTKIS